MVKLNESRRNRTFNVTLRSFRMFDCSQIVTKLFNILASHVLLFITVCITVMGGYDDDDYYYYYCKITGKVHPCTNTESLCKPCGP